MYAPVSFFRFDFRGLHLLSWTRCQPHLAQSPKQYLKPQFADPHYSLNKILISQVVAINLFGLVVVGGENAFHVLTVKQIEEQDNCSKQVRDPAIKTFWKTE